MAKDTDRFVRILTEGNAFGASREVWVDKQNGVNYLWIASGNAGGLTPLLGADGKPLVTRIPTEEE
mgnify:CR=1 FL=1